MEADVNQSPKEETSSTNWLQNEQPICVKGPSTLTSISLPSTMMPAAQVGIDS